MAVIQSSSTMKNASRNVFLQFKNALCNEERQEYASNLLPGRWLEKMLSSY